MTVEHMERRRGQLYRLTLDDGTVLELDCRTCDENGCREGTVLTETALAALTEASGRRRAREKALYLLSVQDRSRGELEKKLRQVSPPELASEVAQQMEDLGLVNDTAYAFRLAQDLRCIKHLPARRAQQELLQRGLDRDLCEQAVEAVRTTDLQQALELLQKKRYNRECDEAVRRKTADFLARRGFDFDTIRRALDGIEPEEF